MAKLFTYLYTGGSWFYRPDDGGADVLPDVGLLVLNVVFLFCINTW